MENKIELLILLSICAGVLGALLVFVGVRCEDSSAATYDNAVGSLFTALGITAIYVMLLLAVAALVLPLLPWINE